jgi:Tol biopolymer transport system component
VERLEDRCVPSTLQAISLPPANQPPSDTAAGASSSSSVSADGRYVAFESTASNLFPGQVQTGTTPVENVFLLDRTTGAVTLVSHLPGQPSVAPVNPPAFTNPLISRNGGYVAYATRATDLVGYNQDVPIVVEYDRVTGTNTLVSHNATSLTTPAATPVDTDCNVDAISDDGRYVVFDTRASDVILNQTSSAKSPGYPQLFLYDRTSGAIQLVTHAFGNDSLTPDQGDPNTNLLQGASVAHDGTVVYESTGTNIASFTTGPFNIYLYSPATKSNRLVTTVAGSPGQDAGLSYRAIISSDGSTVAYSSLAPNLVSGQTGSGVINVFRYSVATGATTLVSGAGGSTTASGNADSGGHGFAVAVSPKGQYIAFASDATDLVPGQTGQPGNVFLYDAQAPGLTLLSGADGSAEDGAGGVPDLQLFGIPDGKEDPVTGQGTQILSISDDGGLVAYVSRAGNLVPGESNPAGVESVYLYSRSSGRSALVSGSRGSATAAANGLSSFPALSGDGTLLAFHTLASDQGGGVFDANGSADVFTAVPGAAGSTLVSRAAFTRVVTGASFSTSVSADGRYTVFTSLATNLVSNQATINGNQNVFVFDDRQGTIALVNHVPGFSNTTGNGGVSLFPDAQIATRLPALLQPVISADGHFIAFTSYDTNLVPGEAFPPQSGKDREVCVYLYDTQTGMIRLVNHVDGEPATIGYPGFNPAISDDGRYVAYTVNFAPPTAQSDFAGGPIALYDSVADATTYITPASYLTNGGTASAPVISDDGRFVAYEDQGNVYLFDRNGAPRTLVSHAAGSLTTLANGASTGAVLSHDGSAIAFTSAATDLVAGQVASSFTNVFLYKNNGSGAVRLVSGMGGSATAGGNGDSGSPAIDGDGSYIAYRSDATNLVGGQTGSAGNVFEFNTQTGGQTLVSHRAGAPAAGAGGSAAPVPDENGFLPGLSTPAIDDDGHLVSYASTAGDLIPGQSGPAGVKNAFTWLRQTGANILASGQGGSPTLTGNADSDGPLLTRDSFPGFSSVATNLLAGLTGTSVAYINTLVAVSLSPDTIAGGSAPGSVVGNLSVTSLLAGQFLSPSYNLPGNEASNGLFRVNQAALLAFLPSSASGAFAIRLHVNVGFGDDPVLLQVFATPGPATGLGGDVGQPLLARLVPVRVGRHKTARLMVEVFDLVSGAEVEALVCPFQAPRYRGITLMPLGNGLYRLSARKGRHTVTTLLTA